MKRMRWAAAVLLAGVCGGGCGGTMTLVYKPIESASERVLVPFTAVGLTHDGVTMYVAPDVKRVVETGTDRQELIVEVMVKNGRDEAVSFQARNVSASIEGKVGRSTSPFESVLKPGEYTGRHVLTIPVTGRGKKDEREDKVELGVDVKGMASGKTYSVRIPLLFVVTESF